MKWEWNVMTVVMIYVSFEATHVMYNTYNLKFPLCDQCVAPNYDRKMYITLHSLKKHRKRIAGIKMIV